MRRSAKATLSFLVLSCSVLVGGGGADADHQGRDRSWELTYLAEPEASEGTSAWGINNRGLVVGDDNQDVPLLWRRSGEVAVLPLPALGGLAAHVLDANEYGMAAGWWAPPGYADGTSAKFHPLIWTRNGVVDPFGGQPKPIGGKAFAVNNRGEVVGEWYDGSGARPFAWRDGDLRDLGPTFSDPGGLQRSAVGINDSGTIIGNGYPFTDDVTGFVIKQGAVEEFASTQMIALNDRGEILAYAGDRDLPAGGKLVILSHERMIDVVVDGCTARLTHGTDLNNRNQVAGYCAEAGFAFVWEDGRTSRLPAPESGATPIALALNDRGVVVGYTQIGATLLAAVWTPAGLERRDD